MTSAEIAWRPTADYVNRSRLKAFIDLHGLRSYDELLARSIADPEWFWRAVLDDLSIEFYEPYTQVLDTSRGIPWARWCVGGRMNIVHNCLDRWIGTPVADRHAFRWETEDGKAGSCTYAELWRGESMRTAGRSHRCAQGRSRGAVHADVPELIITFFAVIRLGAIVLRCSPLRRRRGASRPEEQTTLVPTDSCAAASQSG